jgi:co-chaperonin GroES (HSP10)
MVQEKDIDYVCGSKILISLDEIVETEKNGIVITQTVNETKAKKYARIGTLLDVGTEVYDSKLKIGGKYYFDMNESDMKCTCVGKNLYIIHYMEDGGRILAEITA